MCYLSLVFKNVNLFFKEAMFESESFSLNPVEFFALSCDCLALSQFDRAPSVTHHLLPSTHDLSGQEVFAKLAIGWSEEGIGATVQIDQRASVSHYPLIEKGDSVELFFDTRDVKTSGFNTRFCHHFFFLPHAVDGINKGEKTHFRTEDQHPLCDPEALQCQVQLKKNGYQLSIFIPAPCLHGYEPRQFNRLGFTYRINRHGAESQHFSVVSQDYKIEEQPSLWASLVLVK